MFTLVFTIMLLMPLNRLANGLAIMENGELLLFYNDTRKNIFLTHTFL